MRPNFRAHNKNQEASANGGGVFCTLDELWQEARRAQGFTLNLREHSRALRSGEQRSSVRRRGMEFFESRPYVAQDEMRTIDWKVSARFNNLFTKIFIEEKDRPIYLALDFRASMYFGTRNYFKSVLAAKIAARLAQAAINGGDPVGALIFSIDNISECRSGSRRHDLARLLGLVAKHSRSLPQSGPAPSPDFWPTALNRISHEIPRGSVVFFISDFAALDHTADASLHRLRQRSDVFALYVCDPLEEQLPALGLLGMAYGDTKLYFDSSDIKLREAYRKSHVALSKARSERFRSLGIPELSFSTADNLDEAFKKLFLGTW